MDWKWSASRFERSFTVTLIRFQEVGPHRVALAPQTRFELATFSLTGR